MQTEVVWRLAARARRAPHGLRQQARPGAGRLRAHPRPAAGRASAPASPRSSCPSARRPRSTAWPTCSPTRPSSTTPTATPPRGRDPRRAGGRTSTRSTTTSSRASSWPTTSCSSATSRATCPSVEELEHTLATAWPTATVFPVVCGSATTGVGVDRLADFICEIGPSPARPPASRCSAGDTRDRGRRRRRRPAAGLRVQDDRRPVRRPALAVQGAVAARSRPTTTSSTPAPAPTSACTACSTCGARSRCRSTERGRRRHRRGGQAGRHRAPATRWPPRARRSWSPPIEPPDRGARHRRQGPHPGRRRQARRPPCTGSRTRTRRCVRRAQRRDPPDAAAGHRRDPPGRRPRAAAAQVRRRTSTPRTSGSPTGRPSPARPRPRASTRSRPAATASSAWPCLRVEPLDRGAGLRVRRQDRRRRHPPPVHPRGARRASRRRWPTAASTASPSSTCGSQCFDGKYHSVDSSEMSFKMAGSLGFREAHGQGRRRCVLEPISLLEVTVPADLPGRRDGRPQLPPGPGAGHRVGRQRRAADHRPGADRRRSCATPSTCAR